MIRMPGLDDEIAELRGEIEELKKRLVEQELVTKRLSQMEALNYYFGESGPGSAFFIDGPVVLKMRPSIEKDLSSCPHCKEELINGERGYVVHLKHRGHVVLKGDSLAAFHDRCYEEIMKRFGLE